MSIREKIITFMNKRKDKIATLPMIYKAVYASYSEGENKPAKETVRATLYHSINDEGEKSPFRRIGKGIYLLQGEKTSSLLIEGDSRKLEELEDGSIDCIITDHPWSDKKAHKSGNQKGFAEYDTFVYTLDDFKAKARVLKKGSFLVEFLPIESATNWQYLANIKNMAKEAGFEYYAQTIWRKAPEGAINTGRTTKGVEQMIIFSKGKARRLSPTGKPYLTKNMLSYEVDIPIKAKDKNHQAEKPIELYEYLIENLTEEDEVCLDQFGGACNMVQACVNKSRWGIAYELASDFVKKAVNRFGMTKVSSITEEADNNKECDADINTSNVVLEVIPKESTDYQISYLKKVLTYARTMLTEDEVAFLDTCINADDCYACAMEINAIFKKVNEAGYASYNRPSFDVTLIDYEALNPIYNAISEDFCNKYTDQYTRPSNLNYKLEAEAFAEYCVVKERKQTMNEIKDMSTLRRYIDYVKANYNNLNVSRMETLLTSFIAA